ncbi:MAG TPA: YgaP-like transmembrane domain [bacterium]|jgi:hypothetical protein
MDVNLGSADRMTRMFLGAVLVYAALVLSQTWGVLLWAIAGIALVTGATGRCLIYSLLGLDTAHRPARTAPAQRTFGRTETPQSPDELVGAVRGVMRKGGVRRLTVRQGDWTLIDLPLTATPSGILEVPLLEFIRARAEVSGYHKLTVRH